MTMQVLVNSFGVVLEMVLGYARCYSCRLRPVTDTRRPALVTARVHAE